MLYKKSKDIYQFWLSGFKIIVTKRNGLKGKYEYIYCIFDT